MSIRMATEQDLPQILAIYAPYVQNTTISFEYTVPTLEEFTLRFRAITSQFPWLVWEEKGRILGYAYGSLPFERAAYQWCSEASIYLHPSAHRQGIGKSLYETLENFLALQGYRKVYALVTSQNENSLRFHEAVGYRFVAHFPECGYKFGQWLGVTWLEKPLISVESAKEIPPAIRSARELYTKFSEILDK